MAAERTPLSADDLVDGAVDVDWFRRAHAALGAERWAVLHKAARHASSGTGHRRAQLYADAMLGQLDAGDAAVQDHRQARPGRRPRPRPAAAARCRRR